MSTMAPVMCTGMIALVRGVMAASTQRDIHAEIVLAIDELRDCARIGDRSDRRNERIGGGDDLVARSDADGLQREAKRIGSRIDAECVATPMTWQSAPRTRRPACRA